MLNYLNDLPDEIIVRILSKFSALELLKISSISRRFYKLTDNGNLPLNKFKSSCHNIENDANYQPEINDETLLSLVVDEQKNARHSPRKCALAIQPLHFDPMLGKIYQIKIARKGFIERKGYMGEADFQTWYTDESVIVNIEMEDGDFPFWHVDDSVIIKVDLNGQRNCYSKQEFLKGNYILLTDLSVENFLGRESLHASIQKQQSASFRP